MKDKLRTYGLDAVVNIPLGTHFCQLYQTKEELIELVSPYFKAGLENSEFCIWALPQLLHVNEAEESLKKFIPGFESYLREGQIEIHSGMAWQKEKEKEDTKEGKKLLNFQKDLDNLAEKLNQALERGYSGLRIAEDSSRAKKENWNNFVTYQDKLDSFVCKKPLKTLCTSSLKDFDAFELLDFASRAQFTLVKKAGKWEKIQNNNHKNNDHNKSRKKEPAYKNQYQEIFNSISQGIQVCELIFDEKGQPVDNLILDVNPAYEKHSGLRREQVVGKCIKEILPVVEQAWLDRYAEVVGKREKLHFEEYNASLDMWFEVFASPLEGNEFITVFSDITQRKRMEENQERLKALMDNNPSLVFMKDENGRYVYLNNAYEKQFVHSKDWYGKTDFDFWPKESAEFFRANDAYILESGKPQQNLEDSTDLNGTRHCWLNYKFPFTDSKNERYVGGIRIDVTDRVRTEEALHKAYEEIQNKSKELQNSNEELQVQAEELQAQAEEMQVQAEELRETNKALRDSEEQIRQRAEEIKTVMEVAPVAIWIGHDPQCHNITGNMMANKFYEAEDGENVSANITPVRRFFYKGRELTADELPMQESALKDIDIRNSEFDVLLPSGKRRALLGSASPLHDTNGNVRGSVGAFVDITGRKQADEALHQSEQHYRLLFETMLQGVVYQDADGKIISLNPAAEKILGKTPDEFLGSSSVGEEYLTIREDGSPFPGPEHPAMLSLQKGQKVQDVVMGVYNPRENNYRWITVNAVPIIRPGEEKPFQVYTIFNDITERKRVEDSLRESEERYRTLFNTMDEGFCIIEMLFDENEKPIDYIFTETNPAFERQTGFKNAVGKRIQELAPANEEYWYEIYGNVALTGESARFENRVEELHRWYEVYTYHIGEQESRKVAILFNDITERKQAEEALKKALETLRYSEDQFRTLVQNVKSGIALIDETGRFAVVNPTFMQMFGLDSGLDILNVNSQDWSQWEVYGEDRKLLHVDDHPVRKAVMTGKPVKSQLVAIRNPGANELTWMLINAEPILKENGQIYRVICTYHDITERKQGEEALKKAHDTLEEKVKERTKQLAQAYKSLKENERGLAEAQKMAHIGSWDWNLITREFYWSDEKYRIFGLSPQASKINYELFLSYVHPDDRNYVDNLNKRASRGEPYSIEFRIIAADGTERIVYEQCEAVFDETNIPVRMRGTTQDITERKKTEKALAELETARLREIHHRIKNNLQVISSLLDLQAENLNSKTDLTHSEILEAFRDSQDRVASIALIHEELYAGKGTDSLNFSLYLKKLVKSLFQTYRVGNSNISLKLDLPENIFFDMDNAIPLGIIVNELVSNSLKHAFPDTDAGEIRIKITREAQPADTLKGNKFRGETARRNKSKAELGNGSGISINSSINYTLSVSDNGIGIPESLDLENSETLGLQLVTILTDQLDGTLDIKRSPGSEFIIKFTLADLRNPVE